MRKKLLWIMACLSIYATANAQTWTELGGQDSLQANGYIVALNANANGTVYAAGNFTNSAGNHYVAQWNGTAWTELGGDNSLQANGIIYSVGTDSSGNVYAAGSFTDASGNPYVAEWNGTSWTELGTGSNALATAGASINALAVDASGDVYAGGYFTNSAGNNYVAKWNGSNWTELGGSNSLQANGFVNTLCIGVSGNIYAAGLFTDNAGNAYVAKWDGNNWTELGGTNTPTSTGLITAIATDVNEHIYASGSFYTAPGGVVGVATWDGSTWSELGGVSVNQPGINFQSILTLCVDNASNVYAAGSIEENTQNGNVKYVAKWDGNSWTELGGNASLQANNKINALCSDDLGHIYAAGNFTNIYGKRYVATITNPCTPPNGLTSSAVTGTSALLTWTAAIPAPGDGYEYYYSPDSTTPGVNTVSSGTTASGTTTATVSNLVPSTTYYAWVRSVCDTDNKSPWTAVTIFTTLCTPPSNLTTSGITNTTALLSWTASIPTPGDGYEYYYSMNSTAPGSNTTASGATSPGITTATLSGLTANTNYYAWVRAVCDTDNKSTWTAVTEFTTQNNTGINNVASFQEDLKIYPNPASDKITIENASGHKIEEINVYNMLGQTVYSASSSDISKSVIDVSKFTPGVYNMHIKIDNSFIVRKFEVLK